jgi:hypothetical protein
LKWLCFEVWIVHDLDCITSSYLVLITGVYAPLSWRGYCWLVIKQSQCGMKYFLLKNHGVLLYQPWNSLLSLYLLSHCPANSINRSETQMPKEIIKRKCKSVPVYVMKTYWGEWKCISIYFYIFILDWCWVFSFTSGSLNSLGRNTLHPLTNRLMCLKGRRKYYRS